MSTEPMGRNEPNWRGMMMLAASWEAITRSERAREKRAERLRLDLGGHLLELAAIAGEAFDALNADPYVPDDLNGSMLRLQAAWIRYIDRLDEAVAEAKEALGE